MLVIAVFFYEIFLDGVEGYTYVVRRLLCVVMRCNSY